MKCPRKLGWAIAFAIVPSFLLARVHPFGDAGLYSTSSPAVGISGQSTIPPDVRSLLEAKCANCHSSQTRAPAYGHFAPISWLLERDIMRARKQMDLSKGDSYTPDQQDVFKSKILQQIKTGEMPLLQYRMIHRSTAITEHDLEVLTAWAHAPEPVAEMSPSLAPGDAARGQAVFEKRCTGCHALTRDREGPHLDGVYGRRIGSVAGFSYSTGLRQANSVWNEQTLEKWLTEPDSFIANSNMDFRVPKAQERRDLITYFAHRAAK